MKPFLLLITVLVCFAPLARAQVIINPAALDQLAGIAPKLNPPATLPPQRIAFRRVLPRRLLRPSPARRPVFNRIPAKPRLFAARPVPAPKPEPAAVKLPPPKPPAPPEATLHFAAGAADLPPGAAGLLQPFCRESTATGLITIDAYAAADPADPSAAPRLSMSRAFALRDALVACGVASSRIIPRADGAAATHPDTAEIAATP